MLIQLRVTQVLDHLPSTCIQGDYVWISVLQLAQTRFKFRYVFVGLEEQSYRNGQNHNLKTTTVVQLFEEWYPK